MWVVKFESYSGQANAIAAFHTCESAEVVYNNAVAALRGAYCRYESFGENRAWPGVAFEWEDDYGVKCCVNLANCTIALANADTSNLISWKMFRANKDAENKYKPIYEEGTKVGIAP